MDEEMELLNWSSDGNGEGQQQSDKTPISQSSTAPLQQHQSSPLAPLSVTTTQPPLAALSFPSAGSQRLRPLLHPRTAPLPLPSQSHPHLYSQPPQRQQDLFDPLDPQPAQPLPSATAAAPSLPVKKKFTPLAPIKRSTPSSISAPAKAKSGPAPSTSTSTPKPKPKPEPALSRNQPESSPHEPASSQPKKRKIEWSQPLVVPSRSEDGSGEGPNGFAEVEAEGALADLPLTDAGSAEDTRKKDKSKKKGKSKSKKKKAVSAEEGGGEAEAGLSSLSLSQDEEPTEEPSKKKRKKEKKSRKERKEKRERKRQRAAAQVEQEDEEEEEESVSSAAGPSQLQPQSQSQPQGLIPISQLPTTMPTVSSRFPTRTALLSAVSYASYSQGYSSKILKYETPSQPSLKLGCPLHLPASNPNRCPFFVNASKDKTTGEWVIKKLGGEAEGHNHPPTPQGQRGEWKRPVERNRESGTAYGSEKGKGKSTVKDEDAEQEEETATAEQDSPRHGPQAQPPSSPASTSASKPNNKGKGKQRAPSPSTSSHPRPSSPALRSDHQSPPPDQPYATLALDQDEDHVLDHPLSQLWGSSVTSHKVSLPLPLPLPLLPSSGGGWAEDAPTMEEEEAPLALDLPPPPMLLPLAGEQSQFQLPPLPADLALLAASLDPPLPEALDFELNFDVGMEVEVTVDDDGGDRGREGGRENTAGQEPSQAEMDAFFGFRAPLPPPDLQPQPHPRATLLGTLEPTTTAKQKATGSGLEMIAEASEVEETVDVEVEASGEVGGGKQERGRGNGEPYQLSAIESSLEAEEKRLAIVDSLQRLAVSVLEQLVESVVDSSPVQPQQGGAARQQRKEKRFEPIVVVLAKRGGVDPTTAQATDEHQQPRKTRRLVFPRLSGGGGKGGSTLRLGGRELAAFLKVVETILENVQSNTVSTKRDIFYRSVGLFVKQSVVDTIVEDIAATLRVRRGDLNVVAASKGLFAGSMKVYTTDGVVLEGGGQGALIPAEQLIQRVELDDVKWVLIIEKEAVFHSLCSPEFLAHPQLPHGVLLTGKGYPDLSTRELVHRLSVSRPSIPLLCLVDADPHGLEILSTYKYGSASLSFDRANLAVEEVEWLGIKGTEWDSMGVNRDELLPLTSGDRKKALKMLKRDWMPENWKRELEYMLHLQRKAEIQVLLSASTSSSNANASQSQQSSVGSNSSSARSSSRLIDYMVKKLLEIIA